MPSHADDGDEWEDDWDDDHPEEGDGDDEPTVPCPSCRHEIFADSPRCPNCGRYLSAEDFAGSTKPLWVVVTAAVCLLAAIWMALVAF